MSTDPAAPVPILVVLLAAAGVVVAVRLRRGAGGTAAVCTVATVLLCAVALVDPTVAGARLPTRWRAVDVLFVVDTTGSMAAEDYAGARPRLDGVRADLLELAQTMEGARFALITFDSATQVAVPWTVDVPALASALSVLRQERTNFATGSRLDEPIETMRRVVARRAAAPESEGRPLLVFYVSDGEQTVDAERRSFAGLVAQVDGGAVLGYGTAEGGRMRIYAGRDVAGPYLQDGRTGDDAISRYDESNLLDVAAELGVELLHRTGPGGLGGDFVDRMLADVDARLDSRPGARHLGWLAGWGLVAVVLWQGLATFREAAASRSLGRARERR